jgi:hypothetical protein
VSASQKRELVTIAKSVFRHRILAIGDGANDVGMIRESHCGVAVYGREGSQAVAAGDFAVDRFECLRYLLLVHGAWCFTSTSELILYTFMHNCQYVFVLFYYQLFNGYSGASCIHSFCKYFKVYDSLLIHKYIVDLILYSSLFTVLPQVRIFKLIREFNSLFFCLFSVLLLYLMNIYQLKELYVNLNFINILFIENHIEYHLIG